MSESARENICSHCRTPDPVGGLRPTYRRLAGGGKEAVQLCELCDRTVAGGRFVEGGEPLPEVLVLMQALNIIRKDVAKLLEKLK